ncbi:MAG TPA: hypothetical protein VG602_00495 [Actinomycetota bacterium]|nr:hypothetical protein [Actinomycetota bacterium]
MASHIEQVQKATGPSSMFMETEISSRDPHRLQPRPPWKRFVLMVM